MTTSPSSKDPRSILVIRRDNIGDLVCTTPLLTGLRRRYPIANLHVLANSYNADALRGNPDIDGTFVYCKLKHRLPGESRIVAIWRRIKLIAELRRLRIDVIVLAKSGFDAHGLRFARLIGAPRVIGFAHPDGHPVAGLTEAVPAQRGVLRHEVEALADLGARLGVEDALAPLTVVADAAERQRQLALLEGIAPGTNHLVALHISAREASRRWRPGSIAALVKLLADDPATTVALMWAPGAADDPRHPGDDSLAREVLANTRGLRIAPMPTRSLGELIAALSLCSAFIGADGGAMHLAAGLGLPVVGLFENSEFKLRHWYPWGVPHELVHADGRDVSGIRVEDVFAAWLRLQARMKDVGDPHRAETSATA